MTFPGAAGTYRLTGDELSGVSTLDKAVAAIGTTAAYLSGPTGAISSAPEFVFGAVAVVGGSTPAWNSGWTAETNYSVGTSTLGRAYRLASSTGSFDASGSASGSCRRASPSVISWRCARVPPFEARRPVDGQAGPSLRHVYA